MRLALLFTCVACTTVVHVQDDPIPQPPDSPPTPTPIAGGSGAHTSAVTTYHDSNLRDGVYVVPSLTRFTLQYMHLVTDFDGTYSGVVNAQPLYVPGIGGDTGTYFVVTETNDVIALDEVTGKTKWLRSLGPYANEEGGGCAGMNPLGVTGTPVIDLATRTLYVDGVEAGPFDANALRPLRTHLVHALSIDDGSERDGWPIDVDGVASNDHTFDPTVAHQRGALALVGNRLFVPYGSQGDCGNYRGTVVSIDVSRVSISAPPTVSGIPPLNAWMSPGPQAGVWAPNGVASDGANVFFATGNGGGDALSDWAGGEAVFRFAATNGMKDTPDDVFVAPTWRALDQADKDLGGSGVLLVNQPNAPVPELAIALGKDGFLYALDAAHLGGSVGLPALIQLKVATHDIVDAPAAVPFGGGTLVVFDVQSGGAGVGCPSGQAGGDLVGVQIMPGSPPTTSVAWCAPGWGHGSPIITTTDGVNAPLVWMTGGGGDNALRAYDPKDGSILFDSTDQGVAMPGMYRFNTLIAAHDRLVVAANDRTFAFSWR